MPDGGQFADPALSEMGTIVPSQLRSAKARTECTSKLPLAVGEGATVTAGVHR